MRRVRTSYFPLLLAAAPLKLTNRTEMDAGSAKNFPLLLAAAPLKLRFRRNGVNVRVDFPLLLAAAPLKLDRATSIEFSSGHIFRCF